MLLIRSNQKVCGRLFLLLLGIRRHYDRRWIGRTYVTRVITTELGKPNYSPYL